MRVKVFAILLVLLSFSLLLFGCTQTNSTNNNNSSDNVPQPPALPEDNGTNNASAGSVPQPPALPE